MLANTSYDEAVSLFSWNIPPSYNLGASLCTESRASATALTVVDRDWQSRRYTFHHLDALSNRLANALTASGCRRGDRAAVMLPPSLEAAVAYLAILKTGMIAMPLLAGAAQSHAERLRAAEARAVLASREAAEQYEREWGDVARLRVLVVKDDTEAVAGNLLESWLGRFRSDFVAAPTRPDEPAFLSFTSGSEGAPKGVVQPHSLVLGILPALIFTRMPREGDVVWSTFDWGWLGGLLVALGAWHCGATVLVYEGPALSPGRTVTLLERFGVSRVSIAPTALRMLRIGAGRRRMPALTSITSGGETLDPQTRDWVRESFGIECSELYGLTECSGVIGSGFAVPPRDGALGKPAPGMEVRIVDEDGRPLGSGEVGMIAVRSPHPAMFSGYWQDPGATRRRFVGDLLMTGDLGREDEDGYFRYVSRADDVIKSAGHRIGPSEIEDAFRSHPAVRQCAAVGVPDALSGQAVVLWVELAEGGEARELEPELLATARTRLAPYQMPSRVRFVDKVPLTANGKVKRDEVRQAEAAMAGLSTPREQR